MRRNYDTPYWRKEFRKWLRRKGKGALSGLSDRKAYTAFTAKRRCWRRFRRSKQKLVRLTPGRYNEYKKELETKVQTRPFPRHFSGIIELAFRKNINFRRYKKYKVSYVQKPERKVWFWKLRWTGCGRMRSRGFRSPQNLCQGIAAQKLVLELDESGGPRNFPTRNGAYRGSGSVREEIQYVRTNEKLNE